MRSAVVLVVLVCAAVACGNKDGNGKAGAAAGSGAGSAVAVKIATKQVGVGLRVTLTTEPRTMLFVAPDRGKSDSAEKVTDETGVAEFGIEGATGDNSLLVIASSLDGRKTEHKFPITIGAVEPLTVESATTGAELPLVGCRGFLDGQAGGVEQVSLCPTSMRLAADYTIGLAVKSTGVKKLTIGTSTSEAVNGEVATRVDLKPLMASLTLMKLKDNDYFVSLPVTVELASGARTGTLELQRTAVARMLQGVAKGPVLFPGEKAGAGGKASLVLIGQNNNYPYLGEDVTLDKLDLVALDVATKRVAPSCTYVSTDKDKKKKTVERGTMAYTVTLYERRTGKQVAKKTFTPALPECEEWVRGEIKNSFVGVEDDEIVAWLTATTGLK